ncbi:hypothetical protein K1719_018242 [Acacia pycnantha]|nr:hypothetical protein K1719_018242 [Acacia pycnantha]
MSTETRGEPAPEKKEGRPSISLFQPKTRLHLTDRSPIRTSAVIADALYYNPALTLGILQKLGVALEIFNLWFHMLQQVKKSGICANFKREHDKKVYCLGLTSLLVLPTDQLSEDVLGKAVTPCTRESQGFGFVTMETVEEADHYVKYLNLPVLEGSLRERISLKISDLLSKKLIDVGFEYKYGLEEMLVDAIEFYKEKGYL